MMEGCNILHQLLASLTNNFENDVVRIRWRTVKIEIYVEYNKDYFPGLAARRVSKWDRELFIFNLFYVRFFTIACTVIIRNNTVLDSYQRDDNNYPPIWNRPLYQNVHPNGIFNDNVAGPIFSFFYHITGAFTLGDYNDKIVDYRVKLYCARRPARYTAGLCLLTFRPDYRDGKIKRLHFVFECHDHDVHLTMTNHLDLSFDILLNRPYEFVQHPPENLECTNCMFHRVDCTVIPCLHFICSYCIYDLRANGFKNCLRCTTPYLYVVHFKTIT